VERHGSICILGILRPYRRLRVKRFCVWGRSEKAKERSYEVSEIRHRLLSMAGIGPRPPSLDLFFFFFFRSPRALRLPGRSCSSTAEPGWRRQSLLPGLYRRVGKHLRVAAPRSDDESIECHPI